MVPQRDGLHTGASAEREGEGTAQRDTKLLPRRAVLAGVGSSLLLSTAACGTAAKGRSSDRTSEGTSGAPRKATLAYGVTQLDTSTAWFTSIPRGMNYWADEGLDLTVQALDGGSQSVAAVKAGRAEFATQGTSTLYSSVDDGVALKGFMCEIPDSFELVAVLKESPIKSFSQLKGATIGVNAVGGSPDLTIRAVAALRGWEVGKGKDIEVLAVGTGVPALNALKTNKIQALALWSTPFATLSAQTGAKFRFFRPPPIPDLGFTHATLAMDKTMKDDPKLVASFSRAVAKSLVFMAAADPVELTKLHYKLYPAVKPTGISAAKAVDLGVGTIKATTKYMDFESRVFKQKTPLGAASADVIKANAKLYEKAGTISEVQPAKAYFTKRFIADANDFDFEPIIEKAKKFKVSPD